MNKQGTIKFINPKGYGFVTTDDGDVYIHVKGYRLPSIVFADYPTPLSITYDNTEPLDPKEIDKGAEVVMEVVDGPKGPMGQTWWFAAAEAIMEQKIKDACVYRLITRRIVSSEPYGDPAERCWKARESLLQGVPITGYLHQLEAYQPQVGMQIRAQVKQGDTWCDCPCPMGCYDGGDLFNLPTDWERVRKIGSDRERLTR